MICLLSLINVAWSKTINMFGRRRDSSKVGAKEGSGCELCAVPQPGAGAASHLRRDCSHSLGYRSLRGSTCDLYHSHARQRSYVYLSLFQPYMVYLN